MDAPFPSSDWLGGIKDATVSCNLGSEIELKFFCRGNVATAVKLVSEESLTVAFSPPLPPEEQINIHE